MEQRVKKKHAVPSTANAAYRGGGKTPKTPAGGGKPPTAPSPAQQPSPAARPPGVTTGGRPRACCPCCGAQQACQLCGLDGHIASRCYRRFKQEFLGIGNNGKGNDKQVALASHEQGSTPSYPIDHTWYMDTGATNHLTSEMGKLSTQEPYRGSDQRSASSASRGFSLVDVKHAGVWTAWRSRACAMHARRRSWRPGAICPSHASLVARHRTGLCPRLNAGPCSWLHAGLRHAAWDRFVPRAFLVWAAVAQSCITSRDASWSVLARHRTLVRAGLSCIGHSVCIAVVLDRRGTTTCSRTGCSSPPAMDEEFQALQKNNTWRLVPPESGVNIIDSKWVFKVKKHADGSIERYKARLVAKGFKQSSSDTAIDRLLTALSGVFAVKDLGTLHYFLGLEVSRSSAGLSLTQHKYSLDLLRRAGMLECKHASTPMSATDRLSAFDGDLLTSDDATEYRNIVGGLHIGQL
ncbi:hypothetical protein QYE76_034235 [Lolium multiflorum]|uniref:Reverse transcriptase Ty1/copia-type domain-containing protein n=1 Tax=Lolium multiflorum TaxID=4521 RepID=A0AAD8VK17_LOLMU|nr:hypothetical protein QYE76_034235 [Lolium multiflorum]